MNNNNINTCYKSARFNYRACSSNGNEYLYIFMASLFTQLCVIVRECSMMHIHAETRRLVLSYRSLVSRGMLLRAVVIIGVYIIC